MVNDELRGEFEAREANKIKYVEKAREIIAQLKQFEVEANPRAENTKVDALSKPASSDSVNVEGLVVIDVLREKSITQKAVTVNSINQQGEWFTELVKYKLTGVLPTDPMSARKLRKQANWYVI